MRSKQLSHVQQFNGTPVSPAGGVVESMGWDGGSRLTAPPFGYSPELPLRRSGGPKTRPAHTAADRLPAGVARSLRRLRGLHLRLALCRVEVTAGCDGRLAPIDDRSLIAELADDGALIVIYIHPPGIDDQAATSGLVARVEQSLLHHPVPLGALKIAVLHCDAAAIDDGEAIFHVLNGMARRPLLASGGLAGRVRA